MMTSTRPYLIRAFYDWIVDNGCTPHVVVNAGAADVEVPNEYVDGGQIVLNIAVNAVQGLRLGDHEIEFQARFGGKVRRVCAPIHSILAIYAKENGRGMVFAEEEEGLPSPSSPEPGSHKKKASDKETDNKPSKRAPGDRSHLTVVK
jgi:stringent starvation protein B